MNVLKEKMVFAKNFHQYNLYDELILHFNGKDYKAIVLDICGACYWKEDKQRYDIFVQGKNSIIDTDGLVFINSKINIPFICLSIILIILLFIPIPKKRRRFKSSKALISMFNKSYK